MSTPSTITLLSPAKINLYLSIKHKRPDGFHELVTIFERISLADTITMKTNASGKIMIKCQDPDVPTDQRNLVWKAAVMLQKKFSIAQGVNIRIDKKIPVAAGLGGGSSNAATVLMGLNTAWNIGLSRAQILVLAKAIGSDVPFFIYDCPWGVGRGRGEKIRPLKLGAKLWQVLVVPRVKLQTPKVYGALKIKLTKKDDNDTILIHHLRNNSIYDVGRYIKNDLEEPAERLCPQLRTLKARLKSFETKGVMVSGSGPSVFGLVESKHQAERIKATLGKIYKRVYVVETL